MVTCRAPPRERRGRGRRRQQVAGSTQIGGRHDSRKWLVYLYLLTLPRQRASERPGRLAGRAGARAHTSEAIASSGSPTARERRATPPTTAPVIDICVSGPIATAYPLADSWRARGCTPSSVGITSPRTELARPERAALRQGSAPAADRGAAIRRRRDAAPLARRKGAGARGGDPRRVGRGARPGVGAGVRRRTRRPEGQGCLTTLPQDRRPERGGLPAQLVPALSGHERAHPEGVGCCGTGCLRGR